MLEATDAWALVPEWIMQGNEKLRVAVAPTESQAPLTIQAMWPKSHPPPSFYPYDKAFPKNPTQEEIDAMRAAYQAEVVKTFETVKMAPAIVWDARGNLGGFTPVALAIVSGFATARATDLSYCKTRIPDSSPPTFDDDRYAAYRIEPGGPFAYGGKVAVLTDGLAYSAGDYFPRAVARASDAPVVGSPSSGSYGGGAIRISVDGPPPLSVGVDPTGCFDAATDEPLEGAPLAPTEEVEYAPNDLAKGVDTVLERAVRLIGF
jgi:C-terminal processing protease CtpA/Prc